MLSNDGASDPWLLAPHVIGDGTLVMAGGAFQQVATATVGTFTAANFSAGTLWKITAVGQSGAYWTPFVGKEVRDLTTNAYFYVVADLGTATASITNPLLTNGFGALGTVANGDSLSIGNWPTVYANTVSLANAEFAGGDNSFTTGLIVQQLTFVSPDTNGVLMPSMNGTISETSFPVLNAQGNNTFIGCHMTAVGGLYYGANAFYWGGEIVGPDSFTGGILDEDIVLLNRFHPSGGTITIFGAYWGQGNIDRDTNGPATFILQSDTGQGVGSGHLWGPGQFLAFAGIRVQGEVPYTGNVLLTGGMALDSSGGWPWVPGSNAYGASQAVTPANVDSSKGLWNPQSGAGFFAQQ